MVFGIINWIRHQDNTKTVIIKEVTKKELCIVLLSQVLMFWAYYLLLKSFNTNNLLISTISIVASLIATYFTARRSEYGFVAYIINDLILVTLWGIPVISGSINLIPVLICPILLLINDCYGVYSWNKIKIRQKEEEL